MYSGKEKRVRRRQKGKWWGGEGMKEERDKSRRGYEREGEVMCREGRERRVGEVGRVRDGGEEKA